MIEDTTVFVVDDDEAVRDSMGVMLESMGFRVESFESGEDFLSAYDPSRAGCLIVDVRMRGMSGLELQAKLASRGIPIPVIVISGHGDIPMAVDAVRAGALDFVEKPFDENRLVAAIRRAIAADRERRQQDAGAAELAARYAGLTARQQEVMELVAAGHPNKVIASRLGISARTVEVHRARVMEGMGARSVADLVQMMLRIRSNA